MRKDGEMDKGDGDGCGRERSDERSRKLNHQDLVTEYREEERGCHGQPPCFWLTKPST